MRLDPRFPFDPAKSPFFYGWVVLAAGTLGIVASVPGQTTGLSVFTDFLLEDVGLTRLQLTNAYLMGTVVSGLLLPFGGRILDRVGSRIMGTFAALCLGLTLFALSFADVLGRLLGSLLGTIFDAEWASSAGGFLALALLFVMLRFSGQGLLTMTSRTMVARWFDRYRGLIGAVSGAVVGFTFSMAPLTFLSWIEESGWRGAWREAGGVLLVFSALALLLFRETPEESGLRMDGLRSSENPAQKEARVAEEHAASWSRADALRTSEFWLIALAVSMLSMMGTGITFHLVDLSREAGVPAESFVRLLVPVSFCSIVIGFTMGFLVDRIRVIHIVRFSLFGQVILYLSAAHLEHSALRATMVVGWGMAAGCYGPLTVAAPARLFGRLHLGAISGVLSMVLVLASAAGPVFLTLFQGGTGAYRAGFLAASVLPVLGLIVSVVAPARAQLRNPA